MFKIYEIYPTFCPITDAITGSGARVASAYCYETEALARKIAGKLAERNYQDCGDSNFRAVPVGQPWYANAWTARPPVAPIFVSADPDYDMPF